MAYMVGHSRRPVELGQVDLTLQRVFNKVGPENERGADWAHCMDEPWKTIAEELEIVK